MSNLSGIVAQLRSDGAHKVGVVGFCWGAKVATQAKDVDGVGMAHPRCVWLGWARYAGRGLMCADGWPSLMAPDDAEGAVCPMCILPSQGEDAKVVRTVST